MTNPTEPFSSYFSGLPTSPQPLPAGASIMLLESGAVVQAPANNLQQVYKNFVTDFGGVGDGVTNCQGAFTAFAAYALPLQVPNPTSIVLVFPPGTYFNDPNVSGKSDAGAFFEAIPNLTLLGYGAAITGRFGADHPSIITGVLGAYSWRIKATNVGDTQFTILLANTAMTFAAGNLQCTNAQSFSGGIAFAQSVSSYTSGKFYFEATITALTGVGAQTLGTGWSNGYGPINPQGSSIVGTLSFMVFDDGTIWQGFPGNGAQVGSLGASFSAGNVIGCAIDITNQLGWFRINGGNWNGSGTANPSTGIGGLALSNFHAPYVGWQLTPAFVCTSISANPGSVTHNFGGSSYAFTTPTGFGSWGGTLNTNYPVNIQPNDWVLICSSDAQDVNNYPPNWQFMEWHQVLTVNSTTGVCTIATPNMQYAHSATQPDISVTRNQFQDHGGPASVFLLSPTANPITGLTNNSPITGGTPGAGPNGPNRTQPWVAGLTVFGMSLPSACNGIQNTRFVDCTFPNQVAPGNNQRAIFERCRFNGGTEIDKLITQLDFIDCDWGSSEVGLSSSIEMASFQGCSFHSINTVAKQAAYRECTIQQINLGATYSQNLTLTMENSIVGTLQAAGGGPALALSDTSFANGTFTLNLDSISHNTMTNYWRFTIPGISAQFTANTTLGSPFTILGSNLVRTGGVLTGTIAGGSGYTNGTYRYITLTGGLGFQALANIVVSGNAVTSVTFINEGFHYSVSDVLTAAVGDIGGTGVGFTYTVNTVSANNIVQIFTTLAALPTYVNTTATGIILLEAPSVYFNNNIGIPQITALSQAQDGQPAFSYYYAELNGSNLLGAENINTHITPILKSIGYFVKMRVNVRKPYTGAQSTMLLRLFNQFQTTILKQSGNTWTQSNYNPQFDLKIAGERVITANKVSGLQPTDSDTANGVPLLPFGQTWTGNSSLQAWLNNPIGGDTADKWPVVDVEIITDQSIGTYANTGTIDYLQESGWTYISAAYTAHTGEKILADTAAVAAFTITLPPTPAIGDTVKFYDAGNDFNTNNLTLNRNGSNINSAASNYVSSTQGATLEAVYVNSTIGWRIFL